MAGSGTKFNDFSNPSNYTLGTITQSGNTVTGTGTSFSSNMVGGRLQWSSDSSIDLITAVNVGLQTLTVITSQTRASDSFNIDFGGLGIAQGTIGLSGTVYGATTWNNVQTFPAGLIGNLTGNVTGHASLDLALSGGTMTGFLILNADPTTALGAVTKQYVDTRIPADLYTDATSYTYFGGL